MIGHDVEALKRRGRLLARERGIGRQKALDLVAADEGYRHWGDLLASIPKTAADETPVMAEPARKAPRDWALDHLDTMSGARTGTLDEAAMSVVGSISARIFGTGILGASFASAFGAVLITILYQASRIGNPFATFRIEDAVAPMIDIPLSFVVAALCWHSPHSVRFRRIRYTAIAWCSCITLVTTLSSLGSIRDSVFSAVPPPLEAALGPVNVMGPVILAMWIGTHAGRRRTR